MATICDKCFNFKTFGKKCWYYWDEKKTCSQFRTAPEEEPHFETVEPTVTR